MAMVNVHIDATSTTYGDLLLERIETVARKQGGKFFEDGTHFLNYRMPRKTAGKFVTWMMQFDVEIVIKQHRKGGK